MAKSRHSASGLFMLVIFLAAGIWIYHKWHIMNPCYQTIIETVDAYSDATTQDERRAQLQILLKDASKIDAKTANLVFQYVYLGALDIQDKELQTYCKERIGNTADLTGRQLIPCKKCENACKVCSGRKICLRCNGTGKRLSSVKGRDLEVMCPKQCTICRETGRDLNCTQCQGTGTCPATPKDKMENLGVTIKETAEQKINPFKEILEKLKVDW